MEYVRKKKNYKTNINEFSEIKRSKNENTVINVSNFPKIN